MNHQKRMDTEAGRTRRDGSARERGFTLIELIVVMIVVLVILAIAIPTFMRQKSDASQSGFADSARSYALAIEAFRTDNAGRPPRFNTTEWPANDAKLGPVNQLMAASDGRRRLYMRGGVPDQFISQEGTLSTQAANGFVNHIQYVTRDTVATLGPLQYALIVTAKAPGNKTKVCFLGTDPDPTDADDIRAPMSCDKRQ